MVVNFPVCEDNPYKIDVEKAKVLLAQYKPEMIIFGKSMVLHKEPVAEIRKFVDEQGIRTTIMYDMAHVLGLIGDYFQKPFEEGRRPEVGSVGSHRDAHLPRQRFQPPPRHAGRPAHGGI